LESQCRRQAARHEGTLSPKTSWGDWWDLIAPRRATELAGDGAELEASCVESILRPRWGDIPLNEIGHDDVQGWIDSLNKKYSPGYVRKCYFVFKVSMNKTVKGKDRVLTASPCVDIDLPTVVKKPMPYLEKSEALEVGAELSQAYRDAFDLANETGLRPSELAGMHANRADIKGGWLEVQEVFVCRKKTIKNVPKSGKPRGVALTPKACEIIQRLLAGRDLAAGCGYPHEDGSECNSVLILLTAYNKAVAPDRLRVHVKNAYQKLGRPPKSPYAARRGHATRLAEGGLDPYEVSRQMGHTLEQTMDYVQRTPRTRGRVLSALGESVPLRAVGEGENSGTRPGTHLDSQTLPSTPIQPRESTG
jgi:integrase